MRAFATVLLSISLVASPMFAAGESATDPGKTDAPATPISATVAAAKPAEATKAEAASMEGQLNDLRSLIEAQTQEIEEQRAALKEEQLKMTALEEKIHSVQPTEPVTAAVATPAIGAAAPDPQGGASADAPVQLKIGSAYITPVGFMDFTGVFRNKDGGSGIGSNFSSIPYGPAVTNNLSEFRFSMQNSRIGFRVDAMVKGAHAIGYMESDYLGNNPGNVAVTSNSNTLRSRLYWVDVAKDKWEVLGGQTWSLITPGRVGISPIPGNIFFTQNIDVNYQLGLVWGRIPEFRFVYHPSSKAAFAVALDSPEQYMGGSAGGSAITLPTALGGYANVELNNNGSTLAVPNKAPDVIVKFAVDPSSKFHAEVGGLFREFHVFNTVNSTGYSKSAGGGFLNINVEAFKGMRLLTNNFWSDGGGRYIFGQAPDLIVRADGSISPLRSGSTVSGFEYTHGNSMFYGYYGLLYVARNTALDANGTSLIGYGFAGSSSGQNRTVQEGTVGFNQTIWRDAKYGALNFMGQVSYLTRSPWSVATGSPIHADLGMAFINLRYTLPGGAPSAAQLAGK